MQDELLSEITLGDARGRARGAPPLIAVARPLTPADLPALQSKRALQPGQAPKLKQIRHAHHQLARLLATGMEQNEAALITGYSPAWISNIKNDPQFQDLMATYAGQRQLAFVDVLERMKSLGLTCLEELQERIAEDAGGWSNREMMELAELLLIKPSAVRQANSPGANAPSVAINVKFVNAPQGGSIIEALPAASPSQASTVRNGPLNLLERGDS